MIHSISMTSFASSIAEAMRIKPPKQADAPSGLFTAWLDAHLKNGAERVLIYNPDAVASWLYQKYSEKFAGVARHAGFALPIRTVMPSWTPVCFGTMYTGVSPAVHGIQSYEKHVLATDSLFDAAARAGKRVALVAVENSSLSVIFNERPIDYYIEKYDGEATERALKLLEEDRYDLIAVYNQEYDDCIHRTGTESDQSLAALDHHVASFDRLAQAARRVWRDKNALICWATDHGVHDVGPVTGTHGTDMEEDLNVFHFFGAYPKSL